MGVDPLCFCGQRVRSPSERTQNRTADRREIGRPSAAADRLDVTGPLDRERAESRQVEPLVVERLGGPGRGDYERQRSGLRELRSEGSGRRSLP